MIICNIMGLLSWSWQSTWQWYDKKKGKMPCVREVTTVFVETRLWKTKHQRKCFQNFHQSCMLLTDWIEIHQLQPLVWSSNLLYVMLSGCDWWILIRSVNNTQDWRKFWKRFPGCFVFQSRVSTKTVAVAL